jgi:general secretion pathway protein C
MGVQSFAVIQEDKTKQQMLYHEGDTVAAAIVKRILRSSVILTYNGQDQILEMESEDTKSRAAPAPSIARADNGATAINVDRSVIDDAINDMETLAKQVRVRPHFSGGKPDGLLIYGMRNNVVFTKLGLKNGDIIMGVDGRELNSISDALSMYQTLNQASGAKLKIKRRGKIREIVYNVQ